MLTMNPTCQHSSNCAIVQSQTGTGKFFPPNTKHPKFWDVTLAPRLKKNMHFLRVFLPFVSDNCFYISHLNKNNRNLSMRQNWKEGKANLIFSNYIHSEYILNSQMFPQFMQSRKLAQRVIGTSHAKTGFFNLLHQSGTHQGWFRVFYPSRAS